MLELPSIIRAPVCSVNKQWAKLRARVVFQFQSVFNGATRRLEKKVYALSHSSIDLYAEIAILVFRHHAQAPQRNFTTWVEKLYKRELAEIKDMYTVSEKVSDKDLSAMFALKKLPKENQDSRYALSRCSMCKSTNVNVEARQIRSADEGMSVLASCRDCLHTWTSR